MGPAIQTAWGKLAVFGGSAASVYLAVELTDLTTIAGYGGGVTVIGLAYWVLSSTFRDATSAYRQTAEDLRDQLGDERKQAAEEIALLREQFATEMELFRERHRAEVDLLRDLLDYAKGGVMSNDEKSP